MTNDSTSNFRDYLKHHSSNAHGEMRESARAQADAAVFSDRCRVLYNRALGEAADALRDAGMRPITKIHQTSGLFGRRNNRYTGWPVYIGTWVPSEPSGDNWVHPDPRKRTDFYPSDWRLDDAGRLQCEHSGMDEHENWEFFESFLARKVVEYIADPQKWISY